MKVWVVESVWDDEGSRIESVYDSEEKAQAAAAEARKYKYAGPDRVEVEEFDVE